MTKRLTTLALLAAACCSTASAQLRLPAGSTSDEGIYSRTIIHPDETRTISKQDINNKVREKRTLDKNNVLLMKSIFQLNAGGDPVNGLVYDGRNRLLYRSEFSYDTAGRLEEERVFDASGNLVRRLFYRPDRLGRNKPVSQTVFENGVQSTLGGSDLEDFSTSSPHAYRAAGGVANTPSAYRPTAPSRSEESERSQKRERRFRIFRRD